MHANVGIQQPYKILLD